MKDKSQPSISIEAARKMKEEETIECTKQQRGFSTCHHTVIKCKVYYG